MLIKGHGEDMFYASKIPKESNQRNLVLEWRKTCERIYKRAVTKMGNASMGSGVTAVLTDSRCNQHLTAVGSFERPVRLPAAIRAAKKAGAGSKESMPLITEIDRKYMELAEQKALPKGHTKEYLKRMRDRIAALPPDARGAPLTDDSDGDGGEDTSKFISHYFSIFVPQLWNLTTDGIFLSGISWFIHCSGCRGCSCVKRNRYGNGRSLRKCLLCY